MTLLEVAIALLVVSVGLIGCIGAVGSALRASRDSQHRAVASARAHDLVARMRSNRAGVDADRYRLELAYADIPDGSAEAFACTESATRCDAGGFASADLADWNAGNARLLPGGRGSISGSAGSAYRVTVMWRDANATAADPACLHKSPPEQIAGVRCVNLGFAP